MAWKYVICKVGNREIPVIFPEDLVHAGMAQALAIYHANMAQSLSGGLLSMPALQKIIEDVIPVSAGEVTLDIGACTGSSETLGVKARPTDAALLHGYPYTHGHLVED